MKLLIPLLSVICSLYFCSCSSIQITPTPGQTVIYENGYGIVTSNKPKSFVTVCALGADDDGRVIFDVGVTNKGKRSVTVGLENITAITAEGKPLRIYSRSDIEREARTNAALAAFAVGLSAGAQSYSASQPATTNYSGSYSGASNYSVNNRYGSQIGSVSGTQYGSAYGSSTTYDPARAAVAQQAIQANTIANLGNIQSGLSQRLGGAQSIFASTTLFSGQQYGGRLLTKRSQEIHLQINSGDEVHTADFIVK